MVPIEALASTVIPEGGCVSVCVGWGLGGSGAGGVGGGRWRGGGGGGELYLTPSLPSL